jgi:hypothetical protein
MEKREDRRETATLLFEGVLFFMHCHICYSFHIAILALACMARPHAELVLPAVA